MDDGRPVKLLGIGGSTREVSMSRVALVAALRVAAELGAETSIAPVRELNLPLWNSDLTFADYPPTLGHLLNEVRGADGLVLNSPTYHGTISGAMKNTLDLLDFLGGDDPPYLNGKPVALVGYGGASAMNVINALYHAVRALGGIVVPTVVVLSRDQLDTEAGAITDANAHRRVAGMMREVLDLAEMRALRRTRGAAGA
jgi:FMN reductase